MRNVELLEAEHARAARRRVVHRGAAHPADADNDHVIHAQSAMKRSEGTAESAEHAENLFFWIFAVSAVSAVSYVTVSYIKVCA